MRQVLDSSALVALIHNQAGHDYVYRLIERTQEGEADLYLSELTMVRSSTLWPERGE